MYFNNFKNRDLKIDHQVEVYRNLHLPNCFSIRDSKTKLVLAHSENVLIEDAVFFVGKGREKVLLEKKKNVHAFVKGTLKAVNIPQPTECRNKIFYDPYKAGYFYDELEQKITAANKVFISNGIVYIN